MTWIRLWNQAKNKVHTNHQNRKPLFFPASPSSWICRAHANSISLGARTPGPTNKWVGVGLLWPTHIWALDKIWNFCEWGCLCPIYLDLYCPEVLGSVGRRKGRDNLYLLIKEHSRYYYKNVAVARPSCGCGASFIKEPEINEPIHSSRIWIWIFNSFFFNK